MSYLATTTPGNASWRELLTQVFGPWCIEERVLFPDHPKAWVREPLTFFVGQVAGQEWAELAFCVRPELAVGQRVYYPSPVGHCCSHSQPEVFETLGHGAFNAGIAGTIVELGFDTHPKHCSQTHVVVQLDPATVRGRHAWRVCLPPAPLRIITQEQSEAITYGGLFSV